MENKFVSQVLPSLLQSKSQGTIMMMRLGLATLFVCAVTTVSAVCIDDAKSLDTPGRHIRAKDDISDVELIDSGLKAKLDHGLDQTELLEKKWNMEKSISHLGKDAEEKVIAEGDKFKDLVPLDEELLSKIKHGIDISELTDEEIKSVVIYLKQLGAGKDDIEEFFFGKKDDEDYEEKAYMDKPFEKLDKAIEIPKKEKMYFKEEYFGDKASDEDTKTYLAESMAHMKMAADLKEYPNLKPEVEGFVKKIEDKKVLNPHLKGIEEEELHKKGIESMKLEDLYAYFKKAEAEKAHAEGAAEIAIGKEFHPVMKEIHGKEEFGIDKGLKKVLKFDDDEEKLIDEWKAGHKDLFKKEEEKSYSLDKDFKISDVMKGKSAHDLDKILKDEDLHYAGGSHAYEQAREKAMKDAKVLINDDTLKVRKHLDGAFDFGGEKKIYESKALFTGKAFDEKSHELDHKMAAEIDKALHEEEMKAKGIHGTEAHLAGEKMYGADKKIAFEAGKGVVDEKFLSEDVLKALKEMYGSKLHFGTEAKKDEEIFDIDGKLAFEAGKGIYGEKVHLSEDALKTKDLHAHLEDDLKKVTFHDGKVALGSEKAIFGEKTHFAEDAMKSKTHGINGGIAFGKDKIYTEEIAKKIHGVGSSLHHDDDIAMDDEIYKKEKVHGFEASEEKAFHDHYGKAHVEHGILSGEGHVLHGIEEADKDIHYITDVEKINKEIEAEKKKKVHETGNRFMQFLKNVFGPRKCHLVTMRPHELLGIIDCISKSKDPVLCEKFAMCEKKMPPQVIAVSEKCRKELIPGEMKRCTKMNPLYPSLEIPVKIFQCTARNTKELVPEEKEKVIAFEECARKVKKESCGRARWIRSRF